jgi:regulatory protein
MNQTEALRYTMDLCSRQEKCCSEIREKLEKHDVPKDQIEQVLNTLKKEGFIDENRYAGMFTRDKLRFNKWGKIKIRYMLAGKKIPEEIVNVAINNIDDNTYREILKEELLKKRFHVRGDNPFEIRNKLTRFAQQRGFETGLVVQILDEIEKG